MKYLILLMFVPLLSFSQGDSIQTTETERIIDKYGGKIVESFNEFVDKTTPYAKEGFEVVVRLQIAKGIGYLLFPIVWFLLLLGLINSNFRNWLFEGLSEGDPHWMIVFFYLVGCFVAIYQIYHATLYFMAPEWFAIKEIINLI